MHEALVHLLGREGEARAEQAESRCDLWAELDGVEQRAEE